MKKVGLQCSIGLKNSKLYAVTRYREPNTRIAISMQYRKVMGVYRLHTSYKHFATLGNISDMSLVILKPANSMQ